MKGEITMTSSLAADVSDIIDKGVYSASTSVNQIATMTYWRVGRRNDDTETCLQEDAL